VPRSICSRARSQLSAKTDGKVFSTVLRSSENATTVKHQACVTDEQTQGKRHERASNLGQEEALPTQDCLEATQGARRSMGCQLCLSFKKAQSEVGRGIRARQALQNAYCLGRIVEGGQSGTTILNA
jgi:hypothetical protein